MYRCKNKNYENIMYIIYYAYNNNVYNMQYNNII